MFGVQPSSNDHRGQEEALIGAILLTNGALYAVDELVEPRDFECPSMGLIFKTLRTLIWGGSPATPTTVLSFIAFRLEGKDDIIGFARLVATCAASAPPAKRGSGLSAEHSREIRIRSRLPKGFDRRCCQASGVGYAGRHRQEEWPSSIPAFHPQLKEAVKWISQNLTSEMTRSRRQNAGVMPGWRRLRPTHRNSASWHSMQSKDWHGASRRFTSMMA